jgi:hypothetical protein
MVLDQLLLLLVDEHSNFLVVVVVVVVVVVAVTTHRSSIRLEEELAAAGSQIRLRCTPTTFNWRGSEEMDGWMLLLVCLGLAFV